MFSLKNLIPRLILKDFPTKTSQNMYAFKMKYICYHLVFNSIQKLMFPSCALKLEVCKGSEPVTGNPKTIVCMFVLVLMHVSKYFQICYHTFSNFVIFVNENTENYLLKCAIKGISWDFFIFIFEAQRRENRGSSHII